jgi:M6 family metalloprotease-like protein
MIMEKLFTLLLVSIALIGFSAPTDTVPRLRPPRPPQNTHLAPHVRLNRSEPMTLTNLVIFIRFADEEEFHESFEAIDLMFNDTIPNNISVHNYYNVMTYGKINYNTIFTNDIQDTIISYQDPHPRAYYQPRRSSNPEGYSTMDIAIQRRDVMLANAMHYVDSLHLVDVATNLDGNNDGIIDNISFIIKGDVDDWDDLLWPQMDFFDTVAFPVSINGKTPRAFNLEFAHSYYYFNANTFCHEMGHSLGIPDLYHYYNYFYIEPVYLWDIMAQNDLQQLSAILKYKFLGIIDEPFEITEDGHYVLNSLTSSDQNNCYFIRSYIHPEQWFTIEYRNNDDFMENVPHSGVVIGRWYDNVDVTDILTSGNESFNNTTIPHTYWVFRPNSSSDIVNGDINSAAFGYDNRTSFGPNTNPHPYLTDGTPETSFEITNIQYSGDQASFDVHFLNTGMPAYESKNAYIYPNPVYNELNISLHEVNRVDIYDILGNTMLSETHPDSKINVFSLPQGVYIAKIFTDNGCYMEKFIKK